MVLKKGECIPLTYDFMFTEVFNNQDNLCILEYLIARYFSYDINLVKGHLKLVSRNLQRENKDEPRKQVDLLLDYNGDKINIEMANYNSSGVFERNISYICDIHGRQSRSNWKDYSNIHSSVQIQFIHLGNKFKYNNEDLLSDDVLLQNKIFLTDQRGRIVSKKLRIDEINVDKGIKMNYNNDVDENSIIAMCKLFSAKTIDELEKSARQLMDKLSIEKLVDNVERLGGDDYMVSKYSEISKYEMEYMTSLKEELNKIHEEEFQKGIEEGTRLGILEGISKNRIEMVKNMLKENISIEIIAKCTGLSIDEINNLRK